MTNTALSGARLYWENWGKLGYFNAKGVSIPVAVSVFPDELYPAPRSWAERAYSKLIHYNKLHKGGHFAAWAIAMSTPTRTSELASLPHATEWVNSPPLTEEGLRGKVVLLQFWTYSAGPRPALYVHPAGPAHGIDVDEQGNGAVAEPRM